MDVKMELEGGQYIPSDVGHLQMGSPRMYYIIRPNVYRVAPGYD